MKIIQVVGGFVPAQFGGTKVLCYDLSRELTRRGHEVTVYTTDADIGSRLTDVHGVKNIDGIKVHYFRNLNNLIAYKYKLMLPLGMGLTASKEIGGYDIMHLHEFRSFQNIVMHHYAKKHGIPYVLDAHGSTPRIHGGRGVKWLFRWLFDIAFGYRILRDASKVIAETEVGVNEYKEFGINQDKIVLISPAFPVEDFSQLPSLGLFRQKYNIKEKHIIMFLGRIHWIKGLDFLVESFYQLAQSRSDVMLVIVGPDDGYKPTLDRPIDRLDISDKVLFTGFLGGEEKLSALVDADVVVQTSIYQQGAWAPLEAVLCNTPIIVSSNSGAGEAVRKIDAGYLVEWGNKNELSNTIQYVLDNPAEAENKTQRAKKYIEANLSLAKGVEKYEELYANCIAAKQVNHQGSFT